MDLRGTMKTQRDVVTTVFGREHETETILQAYQRHTDPTSTIITSTKQELLFIRGPLGSGKTALAHSLRQVVHEKSGLFLTGKFQLSRTQSPYVVFTQAFTELVELLLTGHHHSKTMCDSITPDHRLPQIREAIVSACGKETKVLTDMVPALTRIFGDDDGYHDANDDICELSALDTVQRLHFVFGNFCDAISGIVSVVLFLDDLQWSDKASLDLLEVLLQSRPGNDNKPFFIIGAFRDDNLEVTDETDPYLTYSTYGLLKTRQTPFKQFLTEKNFLTDDVSNSQWNVTWIRLTDLDVLSVNKLVAAALDVHCEATGELAVYLHSRCGGNAFHVLVSLRVLIDHDIVRRNDANNSIIFDDSEANELTVGPDKAVDVIVRHNILQTSQFTQDVLTFAACFGDEVDESALCTILDAPLEDIATALETGMQMEVLTFTRNIGRYRFLHDGTRQATLSLVDDLENLSFTVGCKLWKSSMTHFVYNKIFVVASLLLQGTEKVSERPEQLLMATFFLEAGTKAASLAAFPDASCYFEAGIHLLRQDKGFWCKNYTLAIQLINSAIDAALCNQNFDRVATLSNEVITNGRTHQDKITAYTALVNTAGQNGSLQNALDTGLQVLHALGVNLKSEPGLSPIIMALIKTKRAIGRRSDYEILTLPRMKDESKLAAMHLLHNIHPYAAIGGSSCCVTIATTMVQLTMKYGLSKLAGRGFVNLAIVLSRSERKEAQRFGLLALEIVKKFRAVQLIPPVHGCYYFFVSPWTQPITRSFEPLQKAISLGLKNGDFENAMFCSAFRCLLLLLSGYPLAGVSQAYTELLSHLKHYKLTNTHGMAAPYMQLIYNLMGVSHDPHLLKGLIFDPNDVDLENKIQCCICSSVGSELAYRFGDLKLAQKLVEQRNSLPQNLSALPYAVDSFYDGLIAAALLRTDYQQRNRSQYRQIRRSIKMMACLSKDCPQNFRHKHNILKAELYSLSHKKIIRSDVVAMYQEAVDGSLSEGYLQDAALANELAGDYLFYCGDIEEAKGYWNRAVVRYLEWGARAKAAHVRERLVAIM